MCKLRAPRVQQRSNAGELKLSADRSTMTSENVRTWAANTATVALSTLALTASSPQLVPTTPTKDPVFTTAALTPQSSGEGPAPYARVTVVASRSGTRVTKELFVESPTVAGPPLDTVLAAAGQSQLEGEDFALIKLPGRPPRTAAKNTHVTVPDGARVRVVAVHRTTETKSRLLKPKVKRVPDATLKRGLTRIRQPGSAGSVQFRIETVRHDDKVVKRTRTVLQKSQPRTRVVAVGAATPTPAPRSEWPQVQGGAESRNWAALAWCESTDRPDVVSPAGYQGLYQFDVPTWRSVGGTGEPARATREEQTYRAKLLYAQRGAQPWPVCGRRL